MRVSINMATLEYTNIELVNLPTYTFTCVCLGEKLKFAVSWNTRSKRRVLRVSRYNDECILQSTYLNVGEPLDFNFNASRVGYLCNVELCPKDFKGVNQDLLNWEDSYFISVSMTLSDT